MVSQVFYSTSSALVKCSIMACYLRVFPNKTFRKVIYTTGGVVLANWITAVSVNIFQCRPVDAAWNFSASRRDCVDVVAFYTFSGSVNAVTDLVLCTAPLPLLWMLKAQKRERLIISGLFGCGYLYVNPLYQTILRFVLSPGQPTDMPWIGRVLSRLCVCHPYT